VMGRGLGAAERRFFRSASGLLVTEAIALRDRTALHLGHVMGSPVATIVSEVRVVRSKLHTLELILACLFLADPFERGLPATPRDMPEASSSSLKHSSSLEALSCSWAAAAARAGAEAEGLGAAETEPPIAARARVKKASSTL